MKEVRVGGESGGRRAEVATCESVERRESLQYLKKEKKIIVPERNAVETACLFLLLVGGCPSL